MRRGERGLRTAPRSGQCAGCVQRYVALKTVDKVQLCTFARQPDPVAFYKQTASIKKLPAVLRGGLREAAAFLPRIVDTLRAGGGYRW